MGYVTWKRNPRSEGPDTGHHFRRQDEASTVRTNRELMTPKELDTLLVKLAPEALQWGKSKDLHTFWTTCPRCDWLLKLCGRISDDPVEATEPTDTDVMVF